MLLVEYLLCLLLKLVVRCLSYWVGWVVVFGTFGFGCYFVICLFACGCCCVMDFVLAW